LSVSAQELNRLSLEGRVAVITGSSAGIGLAIATKFARLGASIVVNSRTAARAEAAAKMLPAERVCAVGADVSRAEDAERLVTTAIDRFGTIDVLVNNAGIPLAAPSETLDLDRWRTTLEINLTGPFLCAQSAGRHMLARGRGVIINISSVLGHFGMPQRAAYTASKHGLVGLTKVLASEWGPRGVRVLSIDPGYVETEFIVGLKEQGKIDEQAIVRRTPLRRMASREEVADLVAFMAGDGASFISGSNILIDGGWTAYGGW
jgi:3-oxoacyl-[acyl-carrier protein] reductase